MTYFRLKVRRNEEYRSEVASWLCLRFIKREIVKNIDSFKKCFKNLSPASQKKMGEFFIIKCFDDYDWKLDETNQILGQYSENHKLNQDIINFFVTECTADINVSDWLNNTILHKAIECGQDIIFFIEKCGAKVNIPNIGFEAHTAITYAAERAGWLSKEPFVERTPSLIELENANYFIKNGHVNHAHFVKKYPGSEPFIKEYFKKP